VRLESNRIRWTLLSIIILAIIVSVSLWWQNVVYTAGTLSAGMLYGIPSEKDWTDAQAVYETIVSTHHFEHPDPFDPSRMPVYYAAGSRFIITNPIHVSLYEVTTKDEQDAIIAALKNLQRERKLKPIQLRFYAEENWSSGGRRGPEELLREVTVTSPK
jgi:hypothetical protein